jgi:putative peptidoglycan lipid II flippase
MTRPLAGGASDPDAVVQYDRTVLLRLPTGARVLRWLTLWRLQSVNRQIFAAMVTVAFVTAGVKLAAVLKEMTIARQFGAGDEMDAFVIAFLLPSFVVGVVSSAFQAAVIPMYIQVRDREGPEPARLLLSNLTLWSGALLVALTVLLGLSAGAFFQLLGSGFGPGKLLLTRSLFLLLLPIVTLSGLAAIWGAALNAERRFVLVSVSPIATPLLVIVALLAMGRSWGVYSLALGALAGAITEVLLLAYAIRRRGLWVGPRWDAMRPATREVIKQFATMTLGAFLMSSTALVDNLMAAMLGPGSVALLNYGSRLAMFLLGFCSLALSTAILPHFSGLVARSDWITLRHTLRTYLRWTAIATVPVTAALMVFSLPVTRLMFERGAFTPETTVAVAAVQTLYLIHLPFYMMGILLVRLISSLQANHLLMWGSGMNLLVNVGLNYVLMQWIGIRGIALSTTLVYIVSFCFLWVVLSRRLNHIIAAEALPTCA